MSKIAISLNNIPLVVEQNSYVTKIVNAYIAYGLNNWPKLLLRNFTLRNSLFGVTAIVKNSNNAKCLFSGYGVVFGEKMSGVLAMIMLKML